MEAAITAFLNLPTAPRIGSSITPTPNRTKGVASIAHRGHNHSPGKRMARRISAGPSQREHQSHSRLAKRIEAWLVFDEALPRALPSPRNSLARFLVGGAAALGFALIPQLLTFRERKLHLYPAVFEVHPGGDKGQSFLLGLADQLSQFVFVNQKLAGAKRCVVEDVSMVIGPDVRIQKPELPIFY